MSFSDSIKAQALQRSGGRCECDRQQCNHPRQYVGGRCTRRVTQATAEFHHLHAQAAGGGDTLSNCQVLCKECHRQTASYGRH